MAVKQKQEKIGRNDLCPCGSGKKYKKCCMMKKHETQEDMKKIYSDRYGIKLKNEKDIDLLLQALVRISQN